MTNSNIGLNSQYNFKFSQKNVNCDNCGCFGHTYKTCKSPICSWGIILVKIFSETFKKENNINDINEFDETEGIKLNNFKTDFELITHDMNSIKFLLVRRKYSLGYTEFIRGNYKKDNIDGIIYLFQQMTPEEIKGISIYSFDYLWNEFWNGDNKRKISNTDQYIESKKNFELLQMGKDVELPLSFYIKNVIPSYNTPEWGFPKGRKHRGESDIDCATREFCEETGYLQQDIKILYNVKPIIEDMNGTNGISYKFVYYLSEDMSNNIPHISDNNSNEIGDIGFFTYDETMQLLRPYHTEKRKIAKNIYMYYLNNILKIHNNLQDDNSETKLYYNIIDDTNNTEKWSLEPDEF